MKRRLVCARSLVVLLASACLLTPEASAQSFDVDPADGTVTFERDARGVVDDRYDFSVADGNALTFAALASFGPNNSSWINDFAGTLFEGDDVVDTAQWRALPLFVWQELEFAPRWLGPGDYSLRISGLVDGEGEFPITTYRLRMAFGQATPIPEPGTVALMGVGLALLGAIARLRRR
jgi:hypothetical protein